MFITIKAFHLYLNNFLEILYLEAINEFLKLEHFSLEKFLLDCSEKLIHLLLMIIFIRNKIY